MLYYYSCLPGTVLSVDTAGLYWVTFMTPSNPQPSTHKPLDPQPLTELENENEVSDRLVTKYLYFK